MTRQNKTQMTSQRCDIPAVWPWRRGAVTTQNNCATTNMTFQEVPLTLISLSIPRLQGHEWHAAAPHHISLSSPLRHPPRCFNAVAVTFYCGSDWQEGGPTLQRCNYGCRFVCQWHCCYCLQWCTKRQRWVIRGSLFTTVREQNGQAKTRGCIRCQQRLRHCTDVFVCTCIAQ